MKNDQNEYQKVTGNKTVGCNVYCYVPEDIATVEEFTIPKVVIKEEKKENFIKKLINKMYILIRK